MNFSHLHQSAAGSFNAGGALGNEPAALLLRPLFQVAHGTWTLTPGLRWATLNGVPCAIPQFTVSAPVSNQALIRVLILAGFGRDRFDTSEAVSALLLRAAYRPADIDGIHLTALPLVNAVVLDRDLQPGIIRECAGADTATAQVGSPEPQRPDVLIALMSPPSSTELVARVNDGALATDVVAPTLRALGDQHRFETAAHLVPGPLGLGDLASEIGIPTEPGVPEIHLYAPGAASHERRVEALSLALSGIFRRLPKALRA
jgi:hypothetical protein